MTTAADLIAEALDRLGFATRVALAYAWAFQPCDDATGDVRDVLGAAEVAAWDNGHPVEITATLTLPGGYEILAYGFDPVSLDSVTFVGVRPDGSEAELDLEAVAAIADRYAPAAA